MIKGIGVDLVDNNRFEQHKDLNRFLRQILTEGEMYNIERNSVKHLIGARIFSIKEAIFKALNCGTHWGSFWHHVEIQKNNIPHLHGFLKRLSNEQAVSTIHISQSQSKSISVAFVIIE